MVFLKVVIIFLALLSTQVSSNRNTLKVERKEGRKDGRKGGFLPTHSLMAVHRGRESMEAGARGRCSQAEEAESNEH